MKKCRSSVESEATEVNLPGCAPLRPPGTLHQWTQQNSSRCDRRAGYAILCTLVEILLICLVLLAVISFISALLTVNGNQSDKSTEQLAPILRLGKSTAEGQELWAQFGFSEVVKFDLATRKTRPVYRNSSGIMAFQASLDGQTYMASIEDRDVLIFRSRELLVSEPVPNATAPIFALSANGKIAVIVFQGTEVRCWDLSDPNPTSSNYQLPATVNRIALDPSGENLVVATTCGKFNVYEAKTGTQLQELPNVERLKGSPVFSDDARWLAVAAGETLRMIDMRSGESVWQVPTGPFDSLQNVIAMTPDCRLIALAGCRSGIQILNLATGKTVVTFTPDYVVNKMVFSGSEDLLYVCASTLSSIRVWSLSTGSELKPIELM